MVRKTIGLFHAAPEHARWSRISDNKTDGGNREDTFDRSGIARHNFAHGNNRRCTGLPVLPEEFAGSG